MTHSYINGQGTNVVVICDEPDRTCQMCKKETDCRPYGPNGSDICFDCAMSTPELKQNAKKLLNKVFDEPSILQ